ncbi:alpha/beta fold hydrolase [Nocardia sp. NPDC052254]|uniref:alpha/beta fold hydrolase n=1 Tax=Nocardia sp. NPDC052254 TaxID=3155681 RepID=UPI00341317C3
MTAEIVAARTGAGAVTRCVLEVDGIPMSALCARVADPRAVLLVLHGGATTARYFDCPGHPDLSLMRPAASLGCTVLAVDRPGYGASAGHDDIFADPDRRVEAYHRLADHERFWRTDPPALAEIRALCTGAPRFVARTQADSGHNLSVGFAATAYHLGLLSFVAECLRRAEREAPQ